MDTKIHERFLDADKEPCRMLQPIEGYQDLPLVSLEEAVEPITSSCPDIHRRTYIAKTNCKDLHASTLSIEETAAIYLYTMEWEPKVNCLYMSLNNVLRNENRDGLTPWLLYLKLILTALFQLPSIKTTVWRGVKRNLSDQYVVGKKYVWWAFSSCTESLEVLESPVFLGKSAERTLFNINCMNGKRIENYSYIAAEKEILLLPGTQFVVQGKLNPSSNLWIIQLQEVEPDFAWLESPVSCAPIQSNTTNSNLKLGKRISRCLPDCMYLGELNIIDRDVPIIVEKAINTKKCTCLDLNRNIITAKGAQFIANVLSKNTFLQILRFWDNHLLNEGASYITEALCLNSTLTTLCFAKNGLTDECTVNIVRMIKKNKTLKVFYLDNNAITSNGMIVLMNSLKDNKSLQQLYLHNNAITDQSNESIEQMLNSNHTLCLLSLGDNAFSDQGRTHLQNVAKRKNDFRFYI